MTGPRESPTVSEVLWQSVRSPRWNWKAALLSSVWRGGIFLCANLSYGWTAALGALGTEFAYRSVTAGFHGAIMQQMSAARPRWVGTVVTVGGMPVMAHLLEAAVHFARKTPNLAGSIRLSIAFTVLSAAFHLHAMRRGTMITGAEGRSLGADLAAMPGTVCSFLLVGPRAAIRYAGRMRRGWDAG